MAEKRKAIGQPLMKPGQIKEQLIAGGIDLIDVSEAVKQGLGAVDSKGKPDHKTRLDFVKFLTETVEGQPVKRQELVTRKITTQEDLEAQAQASPAFRRALQARLSHIDKSSDSDSTSDSESETIDI